MTKNTTNPPASEAPASGNHYSGRASERVRRYLSDLRARHRTGEKIPLPSVRQIASELQISTATIYHVYKDLIKRGVIETTVGRGSYLQPEQRTDESSQPLCIGLNWPYGDSREPRTTRLTAARDSIIHAISLLESHVNLRPLPFSAFQKGIQKATLLEDVRNVDALIYSATVRELGEDLEIFSAYESCGKPVVRLDAPELNATCNFVATDNLRISRLIGKAWAYTGRRRIVYMARESLNATVSTLATLIGLQSGVALGGITEGSITPVFCEKVTKDAGYEAMKLHIKTVGFAPDAVYCFGDRIAEGAIVALTEAGLSIPEEVSVIGGSGLHARDLTYPEITRVHFSYHEIGKLLVNMVLQRINSNGESAPGIYVPGRLIGNSTTRPMENELFTEWQMFTDDSYDSLLT